MEPAAEGSGLGGPRCGRAIPRGKGHPCGLCYLNEAYRRYGDWLLAAASYNMGMSGVSRRLEEQQGTAYWDLMLNDETARYVYRLYATKQVMESPEQHGFRLAAEDWYAPIPTRDTILVDSVEDLAAFARESGVSYNALKTLNPWLRTGRLPIRKTSTTWSGCRCGESETPLGAHGAPGDLPTCMAVMDRPAGELRASGTVKTRPMGMPIVSAWASRSSARHWASAVPKLSASWTRWSTRAGLWEYRSSVAHSGCPSKVARALNCASLPTAMTTRPPQAHTNDSP